MEKGRKYLDKLLAEIQELEKEIEIKKAKTAELKKKNDAIRAKIEEVKAENRILLRERGWEGITDEEMDWVMAHSDEYYFKLSLGEIRKLMANEKIS